MTKLNLGSGNDVRPDYLNLDVIPAKQPLPPEVFRQGNVGELDWVCQDGSVEEILALNVLQCFPPPVVEQVLANWLRKLRPGGVIKIAFTDLCAIGNPLAGDTLPREQAVTLLFGPPGLPGQRLQDGPGPQGASPTGGWVTERLTSGGLVIETKTHEGAITYVEARKVEDGHVGHAV